ncbi:uncharacterized protein PF3D7_1120600-like [Leguminivora glycinivorella]|uniref:uncharacterized protein PF3D7_1120600-like n=1 Tax=Leguminivora glycinivorella TaxID=1035111 RepID=UPI00200D9B05|nr:uncharacterized protein PF3D7_1120600-like [Leguminivora glycinivorella]
MEDEDFLQPSQFSRTQQRSNSTNRSPMVTSTNPCPGGSQVRPSQPSQARQGSLQTELSQLQDGLRFLTERFQQLSGDSRGIKRPAEPKPNIKEECQICHKLYANKTTLFRHYQGIHKEMNPERFHGYSVNNTVVSLDASFRTIQCPICAYVATTQSALDAHNRTTHSNEVNANIHVAPTQNVDANRTNSNLVANNTAANNGVTNNLDNSNIKDKMHKCEECACYFEEKSKFDEHMKVQHGYEVVCKICNKNLLFKDIDEHVKESHPDVYSKKRKENVEKIIVEKIMRNKRGNRVSVFICTKCDTKMYDKKEADRHARSHKKGLKIKSSRIKVSSAQESIPLVDSDADNVILTCTSCDISTGSYDAAVEHSQNHITNNTQFVTQVCEICDLKFEPLCFKKHIDLHYRNKELHKESFKYFKYRFEFLSFENWFNCFDMADSVMKKMVSESIYAHTRSVKMRVLHEGVCSLYKCCKCNNFVEPAAVHNHTVNYDTCVKVMCSYPCKVCKRTFNNRLARNNHIKNHKSEEAYKIVLFNHENDKEFNEVLNANKLQNTASTSNGIVSKVLYKCLCGLCFVRKETADKHKIICPGKDAKNPCLKCNYFFTREELVVHAFEHHLKETQIVIENIIPEVIVVDSDEEIIEIDSSDDDDDSKNDGLNNIQIRAIKSDHETMAQGSNEVEADIQSMDTIQGAAADASVGNEELVVASERTILIEKTEIDETSEDEERSNHTFEEINNEMTDDDSQDTIAYETIESRSEVVTQAPDTNKQGQLKLVAPNLLISPLFNPNENGFLKLWNIDALSRRINTDIQNVREHIESTTNKPSDVVAIKEERSWLYDPTDFSHISKRQSLRQEVRPRSNDLLIQEVESLLTDDEETENNPGNEEGHNVSNSQTVIEQTINGTNDEEMLNETMNGLNNELLLEVPNINKGNDITHETLNKTDVDNANAPIESNKNGTHEVNLNNSTRIESEEIENNEDQYSDDDLFLPSLPPGIENLGHRQELNDKENENNKVLNDEESNQVNCNEMAANDTPNVITENPTENETETEHANIRSENDSLVTDVINVLNKTVDNNEKGKNEKLNDRPSVLEDTSAITNVDETDTNCRSSAAKDTLTANNIENINSNIQPITALDSSENQIIATDNIINIKRELQYMNINIKRELIEENENTENSCDKDIVQVKREPNYILGNVYNDDKVTEVNDDGGNCSIV